MITLITLTSHISRRVEALFLDPEHPHAGLKQELKTWNQTYHSECLAQLAVHKQGREALLADPSVVPALRAVKESGWSEEAKDFAAVALLALENKELHAAAEGQKHVMLSCACASTCVASSSSSATVRV